MKAYLEIEMPTNCAHCMMWSICPALPNGEWPDYESILTNDVIGDGGAAPGIRHPECPLFPVPPHGRLIDADAFLMLCKDYAITPDDDEFCKRLEYALIKVPTIIPAEEG